MTILVSELSRWGRSTQDLLESLNRLAGWKVSVVATNGMTFELHTPHEAIIPMNQKHPCANYQLGPLKWGCSSALFSQGVCRTR